MVPSFVFPPDLLAVEDVPEDSSRLYAVSPVDVLSLSHPDLEVLVKGVAFDLADKELFCVEEQDVFDRIYSLVKGFRHLVPSFKSIFVEALRSNFSVLLPSLDSLYRASSSSQASPSAASPPSTARDSALHVASHRNAFKIYTYFLLTIALSEEAALASASAVQERSKAGGVSRKKTQPNTWNWETHRSRILSLIANSLEINLSLLFGSSDFDNGHLSFVSKCVFALFENQTLLKDSDSRNGLGRIINALAIKHCRTTESCASIMHLIHKFDFAVPHIAEAVSQGEKKYGDGTLAVALIREISRTNPKDYVRDGVGAENVGRFLVDLADRLPKLMSTNVGILVPHFGGESYKIRNALVGVLGKLVAKAYKDVEGDLSSKALRLRGKQAMLEILFERCRDVSAYTRSRVLHVWSELCEEHAVSIGLWNEVAEVASGRLEDKSAIVRKSALNLLINMLQHNPFGPQLRVAAFEATLEKYKVKLCELESANATAVAYEDDSTPPQAAVVQEGSLSDSWPHCDVEQDERDREVPQVRNFEQVRALVASLEAGLRFSKCITSMMSTLVQLLASTSVTDVENTILLLMTCRQFQIDGSEACLRKMLPLVFSQDKSVYEAVESAFIAVYISKNPVETARGLSNLALESTIGDLAALEHIISSLVSKGEISATTISALWEFFSFSVSGTVASQSRGALSVLCMAAKTSPSILSSHLQDVIDIGFGHWAKEEPLLSRVACTALERISEDDKEKLRFSGTRLFNALKSILVGQCLPENIWYAASDKAISTIYSLHPTPEIFAADIVKLTLGSLFSYEDRGEIHENNHGTNTISTIAAGKLGRCLFIIGHIALNHLVYIESSVRKVRKQKKEENSQSESSFTNGDSSEAANEGGINAELGLAASKDAVIDSLSEKAEKEIVSHDSSRKNLIGICAPFVSRLCRNVILMQKSEELQASAMLALCRLMVIDADYCKANLQLLFTVVENAPSETVRSNCTIALGDLAVRFPNLLEPWTENMYARLRDTSASVRKNAVLVLSHLILNDMMKVKGYINEMAMMTEDNDVRISSLAKLFFHELSKKGNNPIYNLFPDILGRLSNQNVGEESFRNIMQFLINSIKKDKQIDSLAEKLCSRFNGVNDVRQWEHIAYCLSQLTLSEKGIKRLMESYKTYEHILSQDAVMDYFRIIINKSKKFSKPDLKCCLEEFEEKLNKIHLERKEQEMIAAGARKHQEKHYAPEHLILEECNEGRVMEGQDADDNGEVINPHEKDNNFECQTDSPEANDTNSEGCTLSSTLTNCDGGEIEVQSPLMLNTVIPTSKVRRCIGSSTKDHVDYSSMKKATPSTRSQQKK